jgi:hypothetical protein
VDIIIGSKLIKNVRKRVKWKTNWAVKKFKIQRKFDSIDKGRLIKNRRE